LAVAFGLRAPAQMADHPADGRAGEHPSALESQEGLAAVQRQRRHPGAVRWAACQAAVERLLLIQPLGA
jgi:hypothetical protein